jgi:membrane-associated protease RseP (regulator of RpoE activity)
MGSPSSDLPGPARPTPGYAALERDYVPPALDPDVRPQPIVRHLVLFAATLAMTTFMGAQHYLGFLGPAAAAAPGGWALYQHGLWYSAAVLGILGAHEMGHYLACRYYRIDASLPYFIPAPFLIGTLGAFIRIRQPIPNKRELFDVGIAGPIAGFLVAIPVIFIGVSLSTLIKMPTTGGAFIFGEPLLLKAAVWLVWGPREAGMDVNIHPVGIAGWFGLVATLLNLFPFGQLDGGHVSYAVFGRRSTYVSYVTFMAVVGLAVLSASWIAWAGVMVIMMLAFGPHHPRTYDEHTPLDSGRLLLAGFAVVMFVLCFTPVLADYVELGAPK